MISGIKRQPVRGPHRRVVSRLEREDVLECGHTARRYYPDKERRKCSTCFHVRRRLELESEARAI